jgi:hypothetical protein
LSRLSRLFNPVHQCSHIVIYSHFCVFQFLLRLHLYLYPGPMRPWKQSYIKSFIVKWGRRDFLIFCKILFDGTNTGCYDSENRIRIAP